MARWKAMVIAIALVGAGNLFFVSFWHPRYAEGTWLPSQTNDYYSTVGECICHGHPVCMSPGIELLPSAYCVSVPLYQALYRRYGPRPEFVYAAAFRPNFSPMRELYFMSKAECEEWHVGEHSYLKLGACERRRLADVCANPPQVIDPTDAAGKLAVALCNRLAKVPLAQPETAKIAGSQCAPVGEPLVEVRKDKDPATGDYLGSAVAVTYCADDHKLYYQGCADLAWDPTGTTIVYTVRWQKRLTEDQLNHGDNWMFAAKRCFRGVVSGV